VVRYGDPNFIRAFNRAATNAKKQKRRRYFVDVISHGKSVRAGKFLQCHATVE
jgi:hypothetical protein